MFPGLTQVLNQEEEDMRTVFARIVRALSPAAQLQYTNEVARIESVSFYSMRSPTSLLTHRTLIFLVPCPFRYFQVQEE